MDERNHRRTAGRESAKRAGLHRGTAAIWLGSLGLVVLLSGCHSKGEFRFDPSRPYEQIATKIEYPDTCEAPSGSLLETPPPNTVRQEGQPEVWPLTLDEAIHIALSTSQVIRDAGGRVLRAPESVPSVYDPAIAETDPRFGPEAALSAFDAQFNTGVFWEKNDQAVQNLLTGGIAIGPSGITSTGYQQDYAAFKAEMSKTAATGTTFRLENSTEYDMNNRLFNQYTAAYDTIITAEVRHPLLQGSGIEFNRIAGPHAQPGVYNGVVLARISTDVSLADFEVAVRDLLLEVERAYWRLYYAYRDLDAKTAARDSALQTWRFVHRKFEVGQTDREQEALARQQYYLYQLGVIDALGGRELAGGAVGAGGVYATERQLRSLMGLPASDGRLIRPTDEPPTVETVFDWQSSLDQALCRRVEVRRELWQVKRRELELVASKNFLQMRLDFLGQYAWRGLGPQILGRPSAFYQMFEGDYQEWQLGLQLSTPVGNRIGHTAVRNAELQLAREKARYREVERQVVDEAASAFAELDRDYVATRLNYDRAEATRQQLEDVRKKYLGQWVPLQFVLDAQARTTLAETAYYRSLVDYTLAIAELHRTRGTLLDYYEVSLAEGPWRPEAYLSAMKQARRFAPKLLDYTFVVPPPITLGPTPQEGGGGDVDWQPEEAPPQPVAPLPPTVP